MPLQTSYNPDVLSCLANLSSDEVFTPPQVAKQMLDLLPADLWQDPNARFLDPCCKSGVFLREIASRLDKGLEIRIPDRQERINHIMTKQIFGISITELTGLMSRRSLYCSKTANGKYSICTAFDTPEGNIRFRRIEHTWEDGRCTYCGASQSNYDRGTELETHAYEFIHTETPEEFFNMKFDVIIGNPPYQLSSNKAGIQAIPLYNKFVEQAKKLSPKYLVMIIPSRWFSGGIGVNEFRKAMLDDKRIRQLVDYPKSRDCFPGVDIAGGVCYFLWDRDNRGSCIVTTNIGNESVVRERRLNEFDIFIRDNIGIDIVHKVLAKSGGKIMSSKVYSISPFGFPTSKRGVEKPFPDAVALISSSGISYISKDEIVRGTEVIDKFKVAIGQLNPDRGGVNNAKDGKMNVITKVKIFQPNQVFTATYLLIDKFDRQDEAQFCASYLRTKFVRLLISLTLSSMHITKENFRFVPIQGFDKPWTDEELYQKYGLTAEEIAFIEKMVRPMDNGVAEESNGDSAGE